jgi:signal transduction histidine kinase/ligand-binding sensor domain-containing protein
VVRSLLAAGLIILAARPSVAAPRPLPMADFVQDVWDAGEGGFEHPAITAILQTRDRYLWLATYAGAVRFDGVQFRPLEAAGEPAARVAVADHVRCLLEAKDGTLWLGTRHEGLVAVKDGRARVYRRSDGLPSENLRTLAETPDGTLWIGSAEGLMSLDTAGRFRRYTREDGLPSDPAATVFVDAAGTLWVGTTGYGVARFVDGRFVAVPLDLPRDTVTADVAFGLPSGSIGSFARDTDGVLWAGSDAGVIRVPERPGDPSRLIPGLVTGLAASRTGGLWVATGDGLGRLQGGEYHRLTWRDGLLANGVQAVAEDAEGSVWVGTAIGLARLRPRIVHTFTQRDGVGHDDVNCVLETRRGDVWAGHGRGLSRLHDGRWTTLGVADGLPNAGVRTIAEGPDGALWVGTLDGLARYKDGRFQTYRLETPGGRRGFYRVRALAFDARGELWIGSDGLDRWDGARLVRVMAPTDLCDPSPATYLHAAADGTLWLGTRSALMKIRDRRAECLRDVERPRNDIRTIAPDTEGRLWVASAGGIARIEGTSVRNLPGPSGPFRGVVYSILDDQRGALWCSMPGGLFRLEKSKIGDALYRAFGTAEGMDSPVATGGGQPSAWRGGDGRLWFTTATGVAVVDPARIGDPPVGAPLTIDGLVADGRPVDLHGPRRLPAGTRALELRFALLSFVAPEHVRYRYRLEGYDAGWIDSGARREAFYTNLAPGPYRFHVQAAQHGVWGAESPSLELSVAPRFHQTTAFRLSLVGLVLAAAFGLHRLRVQRLRAAFDAVLAERNRIARELHDTLDQGLTATGMQIQAAEREVRAAPDRALTSLGRAREFLLATLEEGRRSVWALRSQALAAGDLATALARVARELSAGTPTAIRVDAQGPLPALPSLVIDQLLRIGQEAMTNAVRHGSARAIVVTLVGDGPGLLLRVRDDGRGFDARAPTDGLGLRGMRERAREIDATLTIESAPGAGTVVSLHLPRG